MKTVLLFLFVTALSLSARAQSLLGQSCVSDAEVMSQNFVMEESSFQEFGSELVEIRSVYGARPYAASFSLSCNDLKKAEEVRQAVLLAISPASVAMSSPLVRNALIAELAGLGIVVGTPAVLGVTVIGTVGIVTIRLLLKKPLEECAKAEREALKNEILQELNSRYGVEAGPNVQLQITR
ncbi:hypothetical protein D3C72_1214260 [compost metagenome]